MCMIKKIFKENWYYILAIVVLIVFFLLLKNSYYMVNIQRSDDLIREFVTKIGDKYLYPMIMITNIGYWYVPVMLILSLLLIYKDRIYFYLMSSMYAFSGIISFVSKLIVLRERPDSSLINMPSSYSFPSGHMLTSICFYFVFAYLLTLKLEKAEKVLFISLFIILSLLIGLSRIYLGVHYFSDVFGGLLLSIPCILMFLNIVKKNFVEVEL